MRKLTAQHYALMCSRSQLLSDGGFYEPLLRWVERFALEVRGVSAPWASRSSDREPIAPPAVSASPASVSLPSSSAQDAVAARNEMTDVGRDAASSTGQAASTSAVVHSRFFATSEAPIGTDVSAPMADDGTVLMPEGLADHYERERRRNGKRKAPT